jgi:hypothetical protein
MAIPDPQMTNYDAQLAMQAANMSVPNPSFGGGFGNMMRRANVGLGNGLGKLQQGLFQIDPTIAAKMTPDQINKARNQAMLQMGLGMMNSAGRGAGLGQAIAQGYGGANENLQGGMQQQYQNQRTDQADTRQLERQGVEDTRYQSEWERQQALDAERRTNQEADRAFKTSQADLEQNRWDKSFAADEAYRSGQLGLGKARNAIDEAAAGQPKVRDIDRVRAEYNTKLGKVSSSMQFADNILTLAASKDINSDPSAQTALVMAFGKMLDPESVVREVEFKILERSRGLQEELQSLLPRLQTGSRLTPEQITRMSNVARLLSSSNKDRSKGITDYYNELAKRRGIDPFEITGTTAAPQEKTGSSIDVSSIFQQRGLGQPPASGSSNRVELSDF